MWVTESWWLFRLAFGYHTKKYKASILTYFVTICSDHIDQPLILRMIGVFTTLQHDLKIATIGQHFNRRTLPII